MKLLNKKRYTIITIIIVFLLMTNFLYIVNKNVLDHLLEITYHQTQEELVTIKNKLIGTNIFSNLDLNKIIVLNYNNRNEITHIDFNMNNSYDILNKTTLIMQELLNVQKKNNIVAVPYGLISNNIFLRNIGSTILVKVRYYGNITGNIKTIINSYGINNSQISVYMSYQIEEQIIIPFKNKLYKNEFELLLGSSIIEGIVPNYYGGRIEKESSIITFPISL